MLKAAPVSQRKSQLGQYFTPPEIAEFMANLFAQRVDTQCRLLDAGAGIGALSAAFLERCVSRELHFSSVEIDAFEIDEQLHPSLAQAFEKYRHHPAVSTKIRSADFIHTAADWISGSFFAEELPKYTHAILNPPYRKIRSNSEHRAALRRAGIETVNLYAAFLALALALLDEHGQLAAIIPRSFCNGPYYRNFRNFILERAAIRHMHLFKSRSKAFKDDDVLQENIIVLLERGGQQGPIRVSNSTDSTFTDLSTHEHPFDRIVFTDDLERFIHVPTSPDRSLVELSPSIRHSLSDLRVDVSTGPVVDFRVRAHLCHMPRAGTAPLLYPGHCRDGRTTWPLAGAKKPNAIQYNEHTRKWLYPNGFYCLVRRFSSKEEKRRIVASVVDPAVFADASLLGFENHLNVFHENKRGLPEALAYGLTVFLNTTAVDEYFRRFNGHTQVNATDLKLLKYPHRDTLLELGKWAMQQEELPQPMIDEKVRNLDA
ncbi:MAG: Eco57I restriction-modification methylase domain-containing protein [Chloroflexi bacterium]|nr:Eco57I restriction-modification methylase domain-containing protein [Chloroflexota bacterium]